VEGGESANSISVSRVREIFDRERWARRDRDEVMRDANVPAFDLTDDGWGAWGDVSKGREKIASELTDERDELVEVVEPRLVSRYD